MSLGGALLWRNTEGIISKWLGGDSRREEQFAGKYLFRKVHSNLNNRSFQRQ